MFPGSEVTAEGKGGTEGRHKWRGYKGRGNAISKITAYRVIDTRCKEHSISDVRSVFRKNQKASRAIRISLSLTPFRSPILAEECNYK